MPLFYDKEIRIYKTSCGPFDNNAYLLVCPHTSEGIIIDAPMEPQPLIEEAKDTNVKYILITHRHQDHLAGLLEIQDATGALIGVHKEDAEALPVKPDFLVDDGDKLSAGAIDVSVSYTPGHTLGSVCYITTNNLFSGDTLFPGGPGHSSSPQNLQQTIKNIVDKLFVLPDHVSLLPGHGKEGTLGLSKHEYGVFAQKNHPDDLSGDVLWLES